jgi:hypothetical protein
MQYFDKNVYFNYSSVKFTQKVQKRQLQYQNSFYLSN